jgi:hypothetical protein
MESVLRFQRALRWATAFLLLAGCTGPPSASAPKAVTGISSAFVLPTAARRPAWISRAASRAKLLYLARYSYGDVKIYDSRTLALVGDLTGFINPQGVALDKQSNLYVVDQGPNEVFVFHRGATTAFRTLTDPDGIALEVVVAHDGTVYLSNEYSPSLGNGNVVVYAPGRNTPTRKITNRDFSVVQDVGLDSSDNLYVTFDDKHLVGRVNEYLAGSFKGARLPIALSAVGGIEFDTANDLIVSDPTAPAVKVFARGSFSLKYEFGTGQIDPDDVAMTYRAARAFVVDPFSGNTYEYALPSGKRLHTIPNPSSTSGVAVER